MRGEDQTQHELFGYGSLEERVPQNHPLRPIRAMVDEALKALDGRFDALYDEDGRRSIPPERLLRALLLQMLYSIRSERMLMEQLEYNLLYRWFVGQSMNEEVWHPTVFTKNRDRLLEGEIAEARLAYLGHILTENRNGLVVNTRVTLATGTAERNAAIEMVEQIPGGSKRVTLGADRGYDTADFVEQMREFRVTPHVAQNDTNRRSAIDARTTSRPGYAISQRKRKRVEEVFGWMKTVALQRKTRFRGPDKVGWMFTFAAAAYNLVRMRNLMAQPA
jgi:transposase